LALTLVATLDKKAAESRVFGDAVWVAFVAAQAADGVCSYVGLRVFGIGIEGNPLIVWFASTFGIGVTLTSAKLIAATCAAFLHRAGRHRTVGVLAILYLTVAVEPWTRVLWP
jgi:hypothetical protein